jgi:hypothetical protein
MSIFERGIAVLALCAASLPVRPLPAGDFDPVVHEAGIESALVAGCDCGAPPVVIPLRGTLVLRREPVRMAGELYTILDVDLASRARGLDGEPQYRLRGPGEMLRAGEDLREQSLRLDLDLNGAAFRFVGATDAPPLAWPAFSIELAGSGEDAGATYRIVLVASPRSPSVIYQLIPAAPGTWDGSTFSNACPVCDPAPIPIEGKFLLREVTGAGGKTGSAFVLDAIDIGWPGNLFAGEGTFEPTGAEGPAMDLSLSWNGERRLAPTSRVWPPTPPLVAFPEIDITVQDRSLSSQWSTFRLLARPSGTAVEFRRGDASGDGKVDLTDAVSILEWLFVAGAEPGCLAAADGNGDGGHDLGDAVFLLGYLFLGGEPPGPPGPTYCGPPADFALGCASSACSP